MDRLAEIKKEHGIQYKLYLTEQLALLTEEYNILLKCKSPMYEYTALIRKTIIETKYYLRQA